MIFIEETARRLGGSSAYHSSTFGVLLLGISLGAAGGGCTAESPPNLVLDVHRPDAYVRPDAPLGCAERPPLSAPVLDPYPDPTTSALQVFRGTASGADLVTARGGVGAAAPAKVGADGRFCIEVTLLPDSTNAVTFAAVDPYGCPGRETLITVSHRTGERQDAGVLSAVNVAKKASIASQLQPDEGALGHVNDGDPSSFAAFSFVDWDAGSSCDKFTWIRVDLGKTYIVTKVKIRWGPSTDGTYATCYSVLLSAASSPADPDPAPAGDWTVAKQVTTGDAADQVLTLNPTAVRFAALLLYEDGATGLWETFKVAELEVWGYDPGATPPPPADHCR
jgi:hypothetical protein